MEVHEKWQLQLEHVGISCCVLSLAQQYVSLEIYHAMVDKRLRSYTL